MTRRPIAVLISDVHYNLNTLAVADKAMRQAINKANELDVRLIVAGDLHDTKANLRAECVTAINATFRTAVYTPVVLVGNHDLINERGTGCALDFIRWADIIIGTSQIADVTFIPYHNNSEVLKQVLATTNTKLIIMHQGLQGSDSGEYIQDRTALAKIDVAGRRIISGHYHRRQDIELPDGGVWSYIGNPYTLNFAEANDPEKGFQILYDDYSLEFVPTYLRKHAVLEMKLENGRLIGTRKATWPEDIVLVKIKGDSAELAKLKKGGIKEQLLLTQDFRLDLIPNENLTVQIEATETYNQYDLLDKTIDSLSNIDQARKERLKTLWKGLV